jgi:hypothetical protein
MIKTQLVGAYYRSEETRMVVLALEFAEVVHLRAEPTNQYDPNAIQIFATITGGPDGDVREFVGYIPKDVCLQVYSLAWQAGCEVNDLFCYILKPFGLKPDLGIFETAQTQDELYAALEGDSGEAPATANWPNNLSDELPEE